jgi:hypothetical protein
MAQRFASKAESSRPSREGGDTLEFVMAGLVPAIRIYLAGAQGGDARDI